MKRTQNNPKLYPVRIISLITKEQYRALRETANQGKCSMNDIVRACLNQLVKEKVITR